MQVRCFSALAVSALLTALSHAAAPADEWLAKARAYLGAETALNAVKSLHFEGTIDTGERVADPADATKTIERPVRLAIDIVFQKPMQQRQIIRSEKVERRTALDGYDGWEKVSDRANPKVSSLTLLDPTGIKRLRASTIENLSFYANHDQDSRQMHLLGDVTVDGVACVQISFAHGSGIVFLRSFDKATGRLIKTGLENGGEIREEGEMIVSGIRFPRKVLNTTPGGKVTGISFDKVTVNEPFPAEAFAVPALPTTR
jgi:hypothetical protein